MPKRAILDPELTVSLPPFLTAATGMDAFTHCLESLTCPSFNPLCDAIAIHGLELVIRYLERATRDGKDIEARGNMQVAAAMGAIAFQKDLGRHALAGASALHRIWPASWTGECVVPSGRDALQSGSGRAALRTPGAHVRWARSATARRRMPPRASVEEVEGMIERLGITRGLRNHGVPRESLREPVRQRFR